MLFSIRVLFTPLADFSLVKNPGASLHALFFNLLRAADPCYATFMHDQTGLRPFTISPIYGSKGIQKNFPAGALCKVRFTLLSSATFTRLSEYFLGLCDPVKKLHLNGTPIKLEEVICHEDYHDFQTGFSDYSDLWHNAETSQKILMQFITPTTFRHGDINIPMPLPRLVFQSLAIKWQHFSGDKYPLSESFSDFVDRFVFPARFNIQSNILDYGSNKRYLGFTGSCVYGVQSINDANIALVKQLNMLADFAFYAGVGQKTTMGMGQARRLPLCDIQGGMAGE